MIGRRLSGFGLAMMAAAVMAPAVAVEAVEPERRPPPEPVERAVARREPLSPVTRRDSGTREIERHRRQLAKIAARRRQE